MQTLRLKVICYIISWIVATIYEVNQVETGNCTVCYSSASQGNCQASITRLFLRTFNHKLNTTMCLEKLKILKMLFEVIRYTDLYLTCQLS